MGFNHEVCTIHRDPLFRCLSSPSFLNGFHIIQKMSLPPTGPLASFTELPDLVRGVVTQVTAQFICDLMSTCSSFNPSELSLVLSSVTPPPELTSTILPARESTHDDSDSTGLEELCESEMQGATADSSSEPILQLIECHEMKLESMEPCSEQRRGPTTGGHFYEFTKNVPARIAFCRRGVRCKICFHLFKGPTCVARLVEHTKVKHRHRASPKHLEQLQVENTAQLIIGDGMRLCRCKSCTYIAPGSQHRHSAY